VKYQVFAACPESYKRAEIEHKSFVEKTSLGLFRDNEEKMRVTSIN
jgi:hypothetical protein